MFCFHGVSQAHFVLNDPPAATEQNDLGNPQKAPPCGDDGSATATNIVTAYQAGSTITVTIDETVYHPGHYRIALAVDDISELPDPPPVTPGDTPCGSAPIDPNPAFPVLADGVFEHSAMFGESQSIDITLPDDITCTNCTLQIIQFMSNHGLNNPGGCYYHHCATISIDDEPMMTTGVTTADESGGSSEGGSTSAATDPTADGSGSNGNTSNGNGSNADSNSGSASGGTTVAIDTDPGQAPMDGEEGCSCSLPGRSGGGALWGMLGLLGLVGLRARRRAA